MRINQLSLTNFRNYARLELELPGGIILLHGDNAQGKTNLLESIYFLATTRSPHASQEQQLINWTALEGEEPVVVSRLVADILRPDNPRHVEMRLIREERNSPVNGQGTFRREALVNRRKVRLMDLLGQLRVVLFLPEDVDLATGPPANRRRYMNITLCQVDPDYCRYLTEYNKILEQRNALLRQMAEGRTRASIDILQILNEKLLPIAAKIVSRRAAFLADMGRQAQEIYFRDLIGQRESIRMVYLPGWTTNGRRSLETSLSDGEWLQENLDVDTIHNRLQRELIAAQQMDIQRGTSTVGPHRDDWSVMINGKNLGLYGSRGQVRTAILAIKLAEITWMKASTSDVPILLLDEVIAELDHQRREALLNYIMDQVRDQNMAQALLTSTDQRMFTPDFLAQASSMTVQEGRVKKDQPYREA